MASTDDTNEPLVGGPYRPVLVAQGAGQGGYWIEDERGIHVTGTRFYAPSELEDATKMCILLNNAYTEGQESRHEAV